MTTTYKGYNISIEKDFSAHPTLSYVAYINDISGKREHTRGDSESSALEHLKTKIDNYFTFNRLRYLPLSEDKQKELISFVQNHATEIERVIRSKHYICPDRFYTISPAAMYNHCDLINNALASAQVNYSLDVATIQNNQTKCIEKIILYDQEYYSTSARRTVLEELLRNL